jgi:hypothetical protein
MKEMIHAINLSIKIWIHSGKDEKVFKDKMKWISLSFQRRCLEEFKKKNLWISIRNIACWTKA